MSTSNVGHHENEYRNLVTSLSLSKTIDGLLISLESFFYVLENDSLKYGYKIEDEIKHYLFKKDSEPLLVGIKNCWSSFEYLVFDTPRFKLVRKYYEVIKEIIGTKKELGIEKNYECISPPALWRKEAEETNYKESDLLKPTPIKVKKMRKYSIVEILIYTSFIVSIVGILLKFFLG